MSDSDYKEFDWFELIRAADGGPILQTEPRRVTFSNGRTMRIAHNVQSLTVGDDAAEIALSTPPRCGGVWLDNGPLWNDNGPVWCETNA